MKRMVVIGGIVIALIAVIKIGSIFIAPSEKEPTEGQTSTEETYQAPSVTPGTTVAKEPVTIEIENGGGAENPLETLPADSSESLAAQEAGQAATAEPARTTAAATKAAVGFTVKDMESKTMYAVKSVRVRETPSTDGEIVGGLTPGQDVKATGETSNGWIRVSYNGSTAYVSKSYLSTSKPDVVKETTAAKKSNTGGSSSSGNTTKATKPAKESSAAAPTTGAAAPTTAAAAPTTASNEETIAPFPG